MVLAKTDYREETGASTGKKSDENMSQTCHGVGYVLQEILVMYYRRYWLCTTGDSRLWVGHPLILSCWVGCLCMCCTCLSIEGVNISWKAEQELDHTGCCFFREKHHVSHWRQCSLSVGSILSPFLVVALMLMMSTDVDGDVLLRCLLPLFIFLAPHTPCL